MRHSARRMFRWLSHAAEAVAALMLGVMFISFLITILFRYVLNWSSGWASELSAVMWVWLVLWSAAFVLREREEIRFDIIYGAVSARVRRVFTVITAAGVVGLFLLSLPVRGLNELFGEFSSAATLMGAAILAVTLITG